MTTLLRFELDDADAVAREYGANLRHGRALVPVVASAEPLSPARLHLVRRSDGASLELDARILMLLPDGPVRGTAVELVLDDATRQRLERFANGGGADEPVPEPVPEPVYDASPDPLLEALPSLDALPLLDELPLLDPGDAGSDADASDAPTDAEEPASDDGPHEEGAEAAHHDPKIVRIRRLSAIERAKLARDGSLEDRVLLERSFGKVVWEDLLRNPQLTVPEVARIASKGTAPRVMLDLIVDNANWAKQSLVRRALLANPRVSLEGVTKLLRGTPKSELKLIVQGSAYPAAVRGIAKKLLAE